MITLLHCLSYAGGLVGFLFVTLSLASGLLWLAELIEEHSKFAKVVGMRAIYVIIAIHVLLLIVDRLPFLPIAFSIICHLVYLTNFSPTWPFISLSSPKFIASCILVIADHFTWFFHFAAKAQEAKRYRAPTYRYGAKYGGQEAAPGFMDVAAFFGICVWFIPLFLFLSLSANDNALPSSLASAPPSPSVNAVDLGSPHGTPMGEKGAAFARQVTQRFRNAPRTSLLKVALEPIVNLLPALRRTRKRDDEGLLSPRPKTPIRGSPLHSPVGTVPNSYFPWTPSDEPGASAGASGSSYGNSLGVDTARMRPTSPGLGMRKATGGAAPGPPRRVQSEAQVAQGMNPRGIATRNGRPAVGDGALGEPDDMFLPPSAAHVGSANGPAAISLGPKGNEPIGNTEVLEARRKLD